MEILKMMKHGAGKRIPLEEEYKKSTGIKPEDVAKLREWLRTQPHLPNEHITDLDLILAYHCCNRSIELAKQVLDLNLTLRTLFTKIFKDRMYDDKVDNAYKTLLMNTLTIKSPEGYTCLYGILLDRNPKKFVFVDCVKAGLMFLDACQYEEGTWPGIMVLADCEGATLGHLSAFDVQTLQQFLYYVQEAFMLNLKSVHFLNAPSFVNKFMMLLKPFMKKELMDIIHIHEVGSRTLEKFYPMDALPEPKDFTKQRDQCITRVKVNSEFFKMENKKRVVESLRPGKPKTESDIFGGVLGSFKKLDID